MKKNKGISLIGMGTERTKSDTTKSTTEKHVCPIKKTHSKIEALDVAGFSSSVANPNRSGK